MIGTDIRNEWDDTHERTWGNEIGKNPGSVSDFWNIPTKPSKEKHYASYNDSLLVKPILAGCPEYVCNNCGKPRQNIYEDIETPTTKENTYQVDAQGKSGGTKKTFNGGSNRNIIGLTDCRCNAGFSGGIIYDPFMGTGSTAEVAIRSKRNYIGSEMSEEYCKIANDRLLSFHLQPYLF